MHLNRVSHGFADIGNRNIRCVHPLGVAMPERIRRQLFALMRADRGASNFCIDQAAVIAVISEVEVRQYILKEHTVFANSDWKEPTMRQRMDGDLKSSENVRTCR